MTASPDRQHKDPKKKIQNTATKMANDRRRGW